MTKYWPPIPLVKGELFTRFGLPCAQPHTMEGKCLSSVLCIIVLYSFINAVHCDCGEPPNIPYGKLKPEFAAQMTFAVASTVKYDCQHGFIRIPGAKNSVTCLEYSTWSSNDKFCQLQSCGSPGEIDYGYVEAEHFFFGSRVTYHCNMGYNMASKRNYRECQADGTWSNSLPICEGTFCPEPKLINGKISQGRKTNGYNIYDSLTLACNSGYKLNGERRVNCQTDYQWTEFPICELIKGCRSPIIANGRVTHKDGFRYNPEIDGHGFSASNEIDIECDSGYRLVGSSQSRCTSEEKGILFSSYVYKWMPDLPTCQKIVTKPKYDYDDWF